MTAVVALLRAVNIGGGDASRHLGLVNAQVLGNIVILATLRPHEEGIRLVATEVRAPLEEGPTTRVAQKLVHGPREALRIVNGFTRAGSRESHFARVGEES